MSNWQTADLFVRGTDGQAIAKAAVEGIIEQGWSLQNPTTGAMHVRDINADPLTVDDLPALTAALSIGGSVSIWAESGDDADVLVTPRTDRLHFPAGADFRVGFQRMPFRRGSVDTEFPRFVRLWLDLADRIDLVVGFASDEINTEIMAVLGAPADALERFLEGRLRGLPYAVMWDPNRYPLNPHGGARWSDAGIEGRVYIPVWHDQSVTALVPIEP